MTDRRLNVAVLDDGQVGVLLDDGDMSCMSWLAAIDIGTALLVAASYQAHGQGIEVATVAEAIDAGNRVAVDTLRLGDPR